jgi:hypothetical protein
MAINFGATRFSVMPVIKYKVNLTDEEKRQLGALLHQGKSAARSQTRARILLKVASGLQDKDIIQALDVCKNPSTGCGRRS